MGNNFELIKNTTQFNEDFIKNYGEEIDEGYFLEVDVQFLKKLWFAIFTWEDEDWKIRKACN